MRARGSFPCSRSLLSLSLQSDLDSPSDTRKLGLGDKGNESSELRAPDLAGWQGAELHHLLDTFLFPHLCLQAPPLLRPYLGKLVGDGGFIVVP